MKIVERSRTNEAIDRNGGDDIYEIYVNDKRRISTGDGGEPEDNRLCRNLNFVYSIVDLMQEAYEAGKRGEVLECVQELVDEDD